MLVDHTLVISVKEARKLLGNTSRSLSDDQVRDLIMSLTLLARSQITKISSNKELGIEYDHGAED